MEELLGNSEMYMFFDILGEIKKGYDDGASDILNRFKGLGLDEDEYYQSEIEILYNSAEFVKEVPVYEKNNGEIVVGEELHYKYFFSSTDMTEYYRELYRLYSKRLISGSEYRQKRYEMIDFTKKRLFCTNCYMTGAMCFGLYTKINHKYASSIRIDLDYNGACGIIDLAIALIAVFAKHKTELAKLREIYKETEAE